MRFLLCVFLLPLTLFAASNDVTGLAVQADGWSARAYVSGHTTNEALVFNYSSNNIVTPSNTVYLVLSTPAFDSTGAATTTTRTNYGGARVRMAYPYETNNDVVVDSPIVGYRASLSDYVYLGEPITTAVFRTGFLSNTTAAVFPPTNSSAQLYPEPNANWSRVVDWFQITNSTYKVGVRAGYGYPIACVQIRALGLTSGQVQTQTVSEPTVDWGYNTNAAYWNRYAPWMNTAPHEWLATFDLSAFTAHERIKWDFTAFGAVGTNYFTTLAGRYVGPTPFPCSATNLYDPNNDFSTFIAGVDPSRANNTGSAATNVAYGSINPAHYFKDVFAAWNAVTASNNAFAATTHNNPGGGKVYIVTTNQAEFNWTGGTLSAGTTTTADCWAETLTFPGQPIGVITNRANDRNIGHRTKLTNIKISVAGVNVPFNAIGALWLNRCIFDSTGTAPIQICTNVYITDSWVTNWPQGLKAFSAQNTAIKFMRGLDLNGFNEEIVYHTAMGLVKPTTNGGAYSINSDGIAAIPGGRNNSILAECYFGGSKVIGAEFWSLGTAFACSNGAFAENIVLEYVTNNVASGLGTIATANTLNSTNITLRGVGVYGKRIALFYNDSGSAVAWKVMCAVQESYIEIPGIKSDTFGTPNANRIGPWGFVWGANCYGNFISRVESDDAPVSFRQEFTGLNCYDTTVANPVTFVPFDSRQAFYVGGPNTPLGGGNYKFYRGNPVIPNLLAGGSRRYFDLLGRRITPQNAAAGPYALGTFTTISPIGTTTIYPIGTTAIQP